MPTYEHSGVFSYKDEKKNVHLLYPVTKKDNVEGMDEVDQEISDLRSFVGYTDSDIYGVEVDFKNKKFTRLAGAVGMTAGRTLTRSKPLAGGGAVFCPIRALFWPTPGKPPIPKAAH